MDVGPFREPTLTAAVSLPPHPARRQATTGSTHGKNRLFLLFTIMPSLAFRPFSKTNPKAVSRLIASLNPKAPLRPVARPNPKAVPDPRQGPIPKLSPTRGKAQSQSYPRPVASLNPKTALHDPATPD